MAILVIAEHDNRTLKGATLNTLGAAALLGGEVHLLVAGCSCGAVVAQAAAIPAVSKVLVVDAGVYEHQLAENLARLVAALGQRYSHLFAPAGRQIHAIDRGRQPVEAHDVKAAAVGSPADDDFFGLYAGDRLRLAALEGVEHGVPVRCHGRHQLAVGRDPALAELGRPFG